MRKVIIRTCIAAASVFAVAVVAVAIVGYLATQPPEFYAKLKAQPVESVDSQMEIQQRTHEFESWIKSSISLQAGSAATNDYDPTQDIRSLQLTQAQLNSQLKSAGDVQNPRVKILEDRLQVGAELGSESIFVLSFEVRPVVSSDGKLQLDILRTQLGKLPVPLMTLLNFLPDDVDLSGPKMSLDVTGETPRLVLNLTQKQTTPRVLAVRCRQENLTIDFQAPDLASLSKQQTKLAKKD